MSCHGCARARVCVRAPMNLAFGWWPHDRDAPFLRESPLSAEVNTPTPAGVRVWAGSHGQRTDVGAGEKKRER